MIDAKNGSTMTVGPTAKIQFEISEDSPTPITSDKTPALSSTVIVGSQKEKEQCIDIGFVEKLIELWRLRRRILEDKAESGTLAKYSYKAGDVLMNKTQTYGSSYMAKVFKARNQAVSIEERRRAALIMYENYICQHQAILLQCEKEYGFNDKCKTISGNRATFFQH